MFGVDVGLILSLGSSLVGALVWYRAIARSQYAKERELSHVLRNQDQAKEALHDLVLELDGLGDCFAAVNERLTKIEALLITLSGRRLSGEG